MGMNKNRVESVISSDPPWEKWQYPIYNGYKDL